MVSLRSQDDSLRNSIVYSPVGGLITGFRLTTLTAANTPGFALLNAARWMARSGLFVERKQLADRDAPAFALWFPTSKPIHSCFRQAIQVQGDVAC